MALKRKAKTNGTEELVAERSAVHGDFNDVSRIAQLLKDAAKTSKNWSRLTNTQREGVDMILHKIARILSGNPDHADHWDDIAGYAHIVKVRLGPARSWISAPVRQEASDE